MKRTLYFVIFAAIALVSCTKSIDNGAIEGEKVSVSFSADLSMATKASFDSDGAGAFADRCLMQVWMGDILFYEKSVAVTSMTATFNDIVLLKGQTYDFLFWADNTAGDFYDIDTLTNVTMKGTYIGGNDARDAFFAALVGKTVDAAFSETVTLRRPFAQLNVITNDIPSLHTQFPQPSQLMAVLPDSIGVTLTAPSVFNVKTGVASEPVEFKYEAPLYTTTLKTATGSKNTLSMDYFYAPADAGNVVDVKFFAKNSTSGLANISATYTNVPLRRNYRTNVSGSLLTVVGEVTVEIVPTWDGETDF